MSDQNERHPYMRRLEGSQDVLLRDTDGYLHRFTVQQVRLYCRLDRAIRDGIYDSAVMAYPGGYDSFAQLWNRAEDFTYRFSVVGADGAFQINGQHPPESRLAPLPTAPPPTTATPARSSFQEDAIQGLLWDLASRESRKRKRIDEARAEREEKRNRNRGQTMADVFGGLLDDDAELEQFEGMTKIRRRPKKGAKVTIVQPVAGPSGTQAAVATQAETGAKGKEKATDESSKEDGADELMDD